MPLPVNADDVAKRHMWQAVAGHDPENGIEWRLGRKRAEAVGEVDQGVELEHALPGLVADPVKNRLKAGSAAAEEFVAIQAGR